jgi:hypothetical protein
MATPASLIESLWEKTEDYGKTTYELSKLKALEATIMVVTSLVSRVAVFIMVALFLLIFNIGIALLLGSLLGKDYYGFFIVAGFYLLAVVVMHVFLRKWVKKPIGDLIIDQALQ